MPFWQHCGLQCILEEAGKGKASKKWAGLYEIEFGPKKWGLKSYYFSKFQWSLGYIHFNSLSQTPQKEEN